MKISSPLLRLLVLATPLPFSLAHAADANSEPPVVWNNPAPAPTPGLDLQHRSFHSASMGVEVGYNVYLPPHYADVAHAGTRYPVLYFLHGATGNENSDAAGVASLIARLIRDSKIPPVLCV